jgi:hypothetical protein
MAGMFWATAFFGGALRAQEGPGTGSTPTFQMGNLQINVKGSFEAEFNDNINFAHDGRVSDIILRPGVTIGATDKLNDNNTVNLQMGMAWDEYLLHPYLSSYTNFAEVSPDSKLAYILKLPPLTLTIYDSFNFSVAPTDSLDFNPISGQIITNVQAFGRFMNQFGVTADVLMKQYTLYAGLYRYDVFPLESQFEFLRRWQYTGSVGIRDDFSSITYAKLDASYTLNYYQQHLENDSSSWNISGTVGTVYRGFTMNGTIGFTGYGFLQNGTNGDSSQPSTYVGSLSIAQKVPNTNLQHQLSLVRQSSFGYVSNTITVDRIDYRVTYSQFILPKMAGTLDVYFETGDDSGGPAPEDYKKFAISPSINYKLTKRSEWYASYQFTDKFSNFIERTYYQNQFIIGFRYDF